MESTKKIKGALISVFYKDGLEPIVKKLHSENVVIYSTGGTQDFIEKLGIPVVPVETLTTYPEIFGGRVKTLHPAVFGGILYRRELQSDIEQAKHHNIQDIDLVIVDLYPFEQTVASGADHQSIIEKIDIGGISLIRAAAKNFKDVLIVSSVDQYEEVLSILSSQQVSSTLAQRKHFAQLAFMTSSHYDTQIFNYFNQEDPQPVFKESVLKGRTLRYGENPHQRGWFYGDFEAMFTQLHGKELSYNNLLDVDAAVQLMAEFQQNNPTFAILKHNNACGLATRDTLAQAYADALAGDPTSAFGGILIANRPIDIETANLINDLFCEVVIAPDFSEDAQQVLKSKKNRILLIQKHVELPKKQFRTLLNGVIEQDKDFLSENAANFESKTKKQVSAHEIEDLIFANKLVKHTKSNTIVLAKNQQLIASGTGQTSRVDALKQAIEKANSFGFNLKGSVMASDAFFPFPDCVEIAHHAGITAVVQPGGSIKDELSIDYCNQNDLAMVFTGNRHFKH